MAATETTPSLTDFLLARIAEDEEVALRRRETWNRDGGVLDLALTLGPSRVLAECEAKRRIVDGLEEAVNANSRNPSGLGAAKLLGLLDAVHFLALPYADHPGYREQWRP